MQRVANFFFTSMPRVPKLTFQFEKWNEVVVLDLLRDKGDIRCRPPCPYCLPFRFCPVKRNLCLLIHLCLETLEQICFNTSELIQSKKREERELESKDCVFYKHCQKPWRFFYILVKQNIDTLGIYKVLNVDFKPKMLKCRTHWFWIFFKYESPKTNLIHQKCSLWLLQFRNFITDSAVNVNHSRNTMTFI